jgi:RNA polymerase sigma-70 factor (ECF subfamily)
MHADGPAALDAIVARVRAGDREAFVALIEATQDELRCFVAAHAASADQIEEAVQAAYVTVFELIGDYRCEGTFLPWLKGIARNRLRQETARRRRWLPAGEAGFEDLLAPHAPPEAEAPRHELLTALDECLARLAEPSRRLVDGFYRERQALDQLAKEHGRTRAAVAMHLSRIRAALRGCLERKGVAW